MSYPRFQLARSHKFVRRMTGTAMTLSGASTSTWYELATATNGPGTGGFDLTLGCQVGDVIEAQLNGLTGTEATNIYTDIATLVAAAPVNYFGSGGTAAGGGVSAWRGEAGAIDSFNGAAWYTIQAGDISSGLVTFRPMARFNTAATAKTIYGNPDWPFFFSVKNLGPVDPN